MRAHLGRVVPVGLLTLAACAGKTPEPQIVYKEVKVAVAVGCVVERPAAVAPLSRRIPSETWRTLAPGAKAAAVQAQAGERMNYQDKLAAATSGCRDVQASK